MFDEINRNFPKKVTRLLNVASHDLSHILMTGQKVRISLVALSVLEILKTPRGSPTRRDATGENEGRLVQASYSTAS